MNEPTKKKKKGGARAGAGAKPKYGCKTVTMRVPADMVDEIRAFICKKKHIEPKPEPEQELEGQVSFSDI
ncbi:hypothetical protein [Ruminococcus albus]|uniref:Uncharacterized protein n=1 Tax=Ruminococcus albus TaxID=1264 RepID=A0A1I1RRD0_RUMAL|nr:hypothetical protein [Ruminococcus albus]SFD36597.1 hypothetical protein SAMN02910406_03754 [Ruminococcus albus]